MSLSAFARRRKTLAALAVVAVGAAALVAYAVSAQGYTVRHEDLNDGGVWVTNDADGLYGRLNKPIEQLDAGFYPPGGAQAAYTLDIVQDGSAVLAWDKGAGKLYPVDVRSGKAVASQGAAVAGDDLLELAGGTAAVLDPASGKVWAAQMVGGDTSTVSELDSSHKPIKTGARADLAVGQDGTVYVVSAATQMLYTIRPQGIGFAAPVATKLDQKAVHLRVTAVGSTPVVLDVDTGTLLIPGRRDARLPRAAVSPDAVLQQPGPQAAAVLVATPSTWLSVPLATGPTATLFTGGTGTPARPVRLGACAHAAWGGTPGVYARSCDGAKAGSQKLPSSGGKVSRPVFRVNHDEVVLNDLTSGRVWVVDDTVHEVDDWQAIRPPKPAHAKNKPSKPSKQTHPSRQDRPPVPKPDHLGARPGRTTVLHVLDNDADPDGDILVVTAVTGLSDPTSPVSIAADGQSVQIALAPDTTSDVHFQYTVSDGRGKSASTDVTVTPRPPGQDRPPNLRYGYKAKTWTVAAGGVFSYPVLGDWRDYDGDPLALLDATAPTGSVASTEDGSIEFTAPNSAGTVQIDYRVSDGIAAPVPGKLTVKVLAADATAAVAASAEPDVVRAVVGRPVTVTPLANDVPGSDPTDPSARMTIAAPIAQPTGASVRTDQTDGTVTVTAKHAGTLLLKYQVAFGSAKLSTGVIRLDAVASSAKPQRPVAMPDTAVLRGQQPSTVDVLANDYDPSGGVLVVQRAVADDANARLQIAVIQGHWLRISSTVAHAEGVRIVRYTITDGLTKPVTGQVAVVQLPVPQQLQPPVPTDDTAIVRAGDYVDVPVLDNDLDPNGQQVQLEPAQSGDLGQGRLNATPALGDAYVDGNFVRYEAPPSVAAPTQVLLDYVLADTSGLTAVGHVRVTVNPVPASAAQDQPPAPQAIERSVVAGDEITITVPSTNVDPDGDSISVVGLAGAPMLGRVTSIGPTTLTYDSYPLSHGTDTFAYTVTDRFGLTATAQIRMGVVPPGDPQPPVAVDDHVTAAPGARVHVAVLANDYTAADDTPGIQPLGTTNEPVPQGVSLDKDRIVLTAPAATGKPLVVSYAIVGGTGARSVAQVIVDSRPHYDIPPVARDDVAKVKRGATRATVDVLANDDDPDGNTAALKISHVFAAEATVAGGKISAPVRPYAQAIGYAISDADGASALGIIHVPGNGGTAPGLRTTITPIQMAANSTKSVDIADYVVDPVGKKLSLTTNDKIWASPGDGLTATSKNATTLSLTSRNHYTGPAAVVFQITNGPLSDPKSQQVIVSVPVQIGKAHPVLRCPSTPLITVQGGPPVTVDLLTMCHVWLQDMSALDSVNFAVAWSKQDDGVQLAKNGNSGLTVTPTAQAHAGTSGSITVAVPGSPARATLNVRVVAAPPPTISPITVRGLKAGQSQTVDVRPYVQTPIAGASVSVVSASPASQQGVSVSASGPRLTIRAAPGGTHGTMTFGLVVTDVTGPGHDDRHVNGTITVEVLGLPGTPGRPSVVQTLSHTAVVAFATPPANGAPIDQIEVHDNHGGTHTCPASPCTINGLSNGHPYTFTLRAHNVVGWGKLSPPSSAITPDALPNAVTGVAATAADQAAHVRWATGTVDGTPITSYQLQVSPAPDNGPGVVTVAAPTTARTVSGLSNGVTYSFKVRSRNKKGFGPWSSPSSAIPFGTPVAPAAPSASGVEAADRSHKAISVSWSAPSDNGNGRPIRGYTLTAYKSGVAQAPIDEGTKTSATFTVPNDNGLWTYSVTATNSGGKTSPSSARSSPAVDASSVPAGMARPGASVGNNAPNQARVTYQLPADNGKPITAIVVSWNGGSKTCGTSGACTISGLQDGTGYRFSAHAVNANGAGPESAQSKSVTPYYSPTPAPAATAKASGQKVNYSWHITPAVSDPTISCSVTWTGGGSSHDCSGNASSTVGYQAKGVINVSVSGHNGTKKTSAQDTTGAKPLNPKASIAWGPKVHETTDPPGVCTSQYCHYFRVNVSGFKPNSTVSGTLEPEQDWDSGTRSFSIRTNSAGSGSWTSGTSYFGFPGVLIDIKIDGKTYKSPWPRN